MIDIIIEYGNEILQWLLGGVILLRSIFGKNEE